MAVTKAQIFEAADSITAAGQTPTLEAVRKRTGGSYTTISPALNEWKTGQATAGGPLREPAPQAVSDRMGMLGAEVWAVALDLANTRLAAEREGLEKARAELESGRDEAAELADKLANEVETLQSSLALVEAAEAGLLNEVGELRANLTAAQTRTEIAEMKAYEIGLRASELRAELDRAHEYVQQAREESARLSGALLAARE